MTSPTTLAAPLDAVQPAAGPGSGRGSDAALTDAFQSALRAAGEALYADPEAVGRTLLNGVDGFRLRETRLHDSAGRALGAAPATGPAPAGATPSASVSAVHAPTPAAGAPASNGAPDAASLRSMGTQAVGMMMETYNFALQASLISNAATTFTSSLNTLIKTQ